MKQQLLKTQGITLRSFDVKSNDRIAYVLTQDLGLIKIYVAGAKSTKHPGSIATMTFVECEWVINEGNEELYFYKDVSVSSQNLHLRSELKILQTACNLIQHTEKGIAVGEPVPEIFDLFRLFLKCLPEATSPKSLEAVFELKLLLFQGLIGDQDPLEFQELAELRSLTTLLTLNLSDSVIEGIENLFFERFS